MRFTSYTLTALAIFMAACSGPTDTSTRPKGPTGATAGPNAPVPVGSGATRVPTDTETPLAPVGSEMVATNPNVSTAPPGANCGNGKLDTTTDVKTNEVCDDGNQLPGDGCAANCLSVERGFSCAEIGKLCLPIALCGDGIKANSEQCDDGNRAIGDGCTDRCKFEVGFKCDVQGTPCTPTVCGDGKREGAEGCDDGNNIPFDGCSEKCLAEPKCVPGGSCSSSCGDGIVIGEGCDDGNTNDGDGCSHECKVESGFMCMPQAVPPCEMLGGDCILRVPAVFRDFTDAHPDFGKNANECTMKVADSDEIIPANIVSPGMVQDTLNAMGRPQLKGTMGTQKCDAKSAKTTYIGVTKLEDWFTNGDGRVTVAGSIVLFNNGSGGFVNRYNSETGEKFEGVEDPICDNVVNVGGTCPDGKTCHVCSYNLKADSTSTDKCVDDITQYDGNPLFFPLDEQPNVPTSDLGDAKVPAPYGYCAWPWEKDVPNLPIKAKKHNFYFTTEVQTWFVYDAMTDAKLSFTGDDDVWVFVNGKLALDLGGIHGPENGDVVINTTTAAKYGLTAGNVYSLSVYQAERRMEGSSFRLTLSGFENTPSDCNANCGDGIVAFGEECDDGKNLGGYGICGKGCKLGEFCGDSIINGPEQCDDGLAGSAKCINCRRTVGGT